MPNSTSLLDRCARWLRALRNVARNERALQGQGVAQEASLVEIEGLRRTLTDISVRMDAYLAHVREALAFLVSRDEAARLEHEADRVETASLRQDMASIADAQRHLQAAVGDLERERARLEAMSAMPPLARTHGTAPATWFNAAFEQTFRGTRAEVRTRLEAYVADVRAARDSTGGMVVDVGCGRGEWLEIMRDAGIPAKGIDENAMIVAQCRELALDVEEADAIAYLGSLPAETLAAVTAFHLVEHLPLARQMQLIAATHRALAPGGILVLETPNPENLLVGAWTFYMDPTHMRPLPPTLLHFMMEAAGFEISGVRRLHPDEALVERATREAWPQGLRELMCAPRDFAILARRPAE